MGVNKQTNAFMKRIVASVGLVALGTSGLQAVAASDLTAESAKPWSVSATLRGFYDDNINSAPNNATVAHRGSFGFEVNPSIQLSWPLERTSLSLGYAYSFKEYEYKPVGNTESYDQTHTFNAALEHAFSELYSVSAHDSFVVGQEPDLLRANNIFTTWQRVPGNNIRNYGGVALDGKLTPLLGFEVGYENAFYDYADSGPLSASATLDRLEHAIHLDSRWQLQPETVGVLGYQFGWTDYTADQQIAIFDPTIMSDVRNERSHYVYVGADHTFRPDLTGSFRAGARFTDYYNDPAASQNTTPFVKLSLRWAYAPESSLEAGFTHDRAATYVTGGTGLTLDSESSVLYASLNQRLAPNLYGSLSGQYQDSVYNGGDFQDKTDQYFGFGANLEYRFSRFFSTHAGYSYDRLNSEIPSRSFDRNRVYLGVTATY